jgi:hypothetical protein
MLLDLYYWVGWRISIESLTSPIRTWVLEQEQQDGPELAERMESLGRADVSKIVSLLVPSHLSGIDREAMYTLANRPLVTPAQWWVAGLLLIAFTLAATLRLMVYWVPLADAAVNRSRSILDMAGAVGRAWIRSLGLHLMAIGVALLLSGPILVGSAALLLIGVDALPLMGLAMLVIAIAGFVIWWFALTAIVVSDAGPLKAAYYGYSVVRTSLSQTVGFAGTLMLITLGLGGIWRAIADTAPGLFIGVIASAFFASGLAMGGMVFYNSRIQSLRSVLTR